jgi:hypothetical protein
LLASPRLQLALELGEVALAQRRRGGQRLQSLHLTDDLTVNSHRQNTCLVATAVIRTRARGRFFNLVDLVNQLEQEKAAGRSGRLSEKLLRYDVIVIDELGYLPFSQSGGQLLFHLISKLYETRRC